MQIQHNETVQETIYEETLANGLKIHILPKLGFAKKEVALTVAYGAIDREAVSLNQPETRLSFPEGTAHFLEHMLFESENENIANRFSACGASVNAYTSSTKTSYFFSTTNGVKEPLDLLFNLVFNPHYTPDLVEKERKIITKEIQMYQDDLDQSIYEDTLDAMYFNHPIKADIAGTEASIGKIDQSVLDLAYETFYHPANIHLVVVGDVDPDAIVAWARAHAFSKVEHHQPQFTRIVCRESAEVKKRQIAKKKDVKTDMLMLGIKLDSTVMKSALANDMEEIRLAFLFDNVFGKTSLAYRNLMDHQLINDTFEFSVTVEDDYGFILLYTETKKPAKTKKALLDLLAHLPDHFTDEERFLVSKRKLLGNYIQTFDHISALSSFLTEYFITGVDLFQLFETIHKVEFSDLKTLYAGISEQAIAVVHYHA